MKITLRPRAEFYIELPKAILDDIIVVATHHYDGKCKEAAYERPATELGRHGFLLRWRNQLGWMDAGSPVLATWDELDTTMKILEMWRYAHISKLTECEPPVIYKFIGEVQRAMMRSQEILRAVDTALNP